MKIISTRFIDALEGLKILMFLCFSLLSSVLSYAESPVDQIDQIKKAYNFEAWAGNVKTNISISNIEGFNNDLQSKLKKQTQLFTPEKETDKHVSLKILEDNIMSGADIDLGIFSSAREAQDAPFKGFSTHSRKPEYTLAIKKSDYDIGDMCLYNMASNLPPGIKQISNRPFIGRLYFTRGNVAVKIINNAEPEKEYLDILAIAKLIDSFLCMKGQEKK